MRGKTNTKKMSIPRPKKRNTKPLNDREGPRKPINKGSQELKSKKKEKNAK